LQRRQVHRPAHSRRRLDRSSLPRPDQIGPEHEEMTMQTMTMKTVLALALTAGLLAAPVARAETEGALPADKAEAATAALVALGYDVRRLALEDGMIEAYAVKNGKTCEVYLAADLTVDHEQCS
jgi:PhoPQ-activated pathogenicity-related protein